MEMHGPLGRGLAYWGRSIFGKDSRWEGGQVLSNCVKKPHRSHLFPWMLSCHSCWWHFPFSWLFFESAHSTQSSEGPGYCASLEPPGVTCERRVASKCKWTGLLGSWKEIHWTLQALSKETISDTCLNTSSGLQGHMHACTHTAERQAVWRIVGFCVEISCLLKAPRDEVMIPRNYPSGHGSGEQGCIRAPRNSELVVPQYCGS